MSIAKITGIFIAGAGLLGASAAFAQTYYSPYGYQQPQYTSPQQYGTCPNIYSNLTVGSRGAQVSALQSFLAARYGDYRLAGGYYGTLTQYYVQRFQQEMGVYPATGGVGPLTRAAILRACGGGTPGYPGYPTTPAADTFRLGRTFTLYPGQSAQEYRGELVVRLDQIDNGYGGWPYYFTSSNPDSARVTLSVSCPPGRYCAAFYYPQQSFTLDEDDMVRYMGYEVELTDLRSDRASFRVEDDGRDDDDDEDDASITVTDPTSGEDFEQGDELRIAWRVDDEPSNASVVLDLYDEDDDRIGTIAIEDGESGSYEWDIPTGGGFCTQQYPNGLCGHDLEGDYYIKARLVAGNGFSGGFEYDEDDSGIFSIED